MFASNVSAPVHQADEHRYLTVDEVAQRIRVSRSKAHNMVNDGEIPAIRIGRLIRVPANEFENYLAAKLTAASSKGMV
jgi:excisionase family DNA binding protein